ncbi:hypothetical protein ACFC06_06960 [Nocardia sp. NPDC056064]|uniref:hypothetical protein n=1 Tax=Nocardia sp. NPDC056064 TaxID=3345701 RepID=UPI0035D6BFBF
MSGGGLFPDAVDEDTQRRPTWWTVVSWVIVALVAVCCLAFLWAVLSRGDWLDRGLVLALLGLVWAVWTVAGWVADRAGRVSLLAPLLAVLTLGAAWSGLPQRLGWMLSESAFEQAARTCAADDGDRRIGVIEVSTISAADDGCLLWVPHMGLIGPAGFAYMPNGEPPVRTGEYEAKYTHHEGPWYRFRY